MSLKSLSLKLRTIKTIISPKLLPISLSLVTTHMINSFQNQPLNSVFAKTRFEQVIKMFYNFQGPLEDYQKNGLTKRNWGREQNIQISQVFDITILPVIKLTSVTPRIY